MEREYLQPGKNIFSKIIYGNFRTNAMRHFWEVESANFLGAGGYLLMRGGGELMRRTALRLTLFYSHVRITIGSSMLLFKCDVPVMYIA